MTNDNHHPFFLLLSLISTFFAWITMHDVQVIATLIATMVSIVSGALAGYYYFKKARAK